jgi:hypothetical protein
VLIATAPAGERLRGLSLLLVPLPALGYVLAAKAWHIEANTDPIAPPTAMSVLDCLVWICPASAVLAASLMPSRRWVVAAYGVATTVVTWLIAIGADMQISGVYP